MRTDSVLISLSITVLVTAMLLDGLLFLDILASNFRPSVQTFTVYAFTASVVLLAVAAVIRRFTSKF